MKTMKNICHNDGTPIKVKEFHIGGDNTYIDFYANGFGAKVFNIAIGGSDKFICFQWSHVGRCLQARWSLYKHWVKWF